MKRVLIAGKGSYIGQSIVRFIKENELPCEAVELDVQDPTWQGFDFSGYDSVVLVAGIAHQKETDESRHLYYEVNRDLAFEIAQASKAASVPHFVMLSTMSVYGMDEGVITPATLPAPKNAYGKSKLEGEQLIHSLEDEHFKVAILRPPMVYGPGCKGNFNSLARLALALPVFPRVDNRRSMIYIDNLCAFIMMCVANQLGGTFFPQDEQYMNTSEMARRIASANGKNLQLSASLGVPTSLLKGFVGKARKAFGTLIYKGTEVHGYSYCIVNWRDGVANASKALSEEQDQPVSNPRTLVAVPKISITTASYNSEATISRTIESILLQTHRPLEYVIMDGASKDRTVEIANSYVDAFREAGIEYHVYSEPDKGMYEAINKAMNRSTGDVIGNVNSDDYLEPEALRKVSNCYQQTRFDVFQANLIVHTAKGSFIKRSFPMPFYESTRGWNHPTLFLAGKAKDYRYRVDNPYADFDLFLRLHKDGYEVEYLDEAISNFSFGGMSTKRSIKDLQKRVGWRNQIYRENNCSPLAYGEGALMEMVKYFKA